MRVEKGAVFSAVRAGFRMEWSVAEELGRREIARENREKREKLSG